MKGQPVCVIETSKSAIELEAPGEGTILHLYEPGAEIELGSPVARIAETSEEGARLGAEREAAGRSAAPEGRPRATRRALELARLHGVDLGAIEKRGFITAEDVEAVAGGQGAPGTSPVPGVSDERVTLPASFSEPAGAGALEPRFLEALRADPGAFRSLSSEQRCRAYREHGARIGADVTLGDGVLLIAPSIVLGDGVEIGDGATVVCEEALAIGTLTRFAPGLELRCRRVFVGEGVHAGRSIRIGGGGHRDPWALLTIGDLTFIGDEVFVNPCRPVLIGREVFLTMRSMLVTHNIGHSVLEGFENRFAPIVLEDRSQVGLGTVVYAGCRVGEAAIVASNSYVVSDIPPGKLAVGVPARVVGAARRELSRGQKAALAGRLVDDLAELLVANGHEVSTLAGAAKAIEVPVEEGASRVLFVERLEHTEERPPGVVETIVLTLEHGGGEPPDGVVVLDLLARELHGGRGPQSALLDAVRELCRKRGIRFEPGPWRYRGGLI